MRSGPGGSGHAPLARSLGRRQARQLQQRLVRDERMQLEAARERMAQRCLPINDTEPLPRID